MERPKCGNCGLISSQTGKCGKMLLKEEFSVNPGAKELLMSTNLRGFCDYHIPARGMESKIDYSFTEKEVELWH